MNKNYKTLRDALIESHAQLYNMSTKLNEFTKNINEGFQHIHDTFNIFFNETLQNENNALDSILKTQETTINVLNLLQKHILIDHFRDVIDHCKNHKLPSILLAPNILAEDLKTLNKKLENEHLTLAIPYTNIMSYYTRPSTSCHMTIDEILISIKIPLITLGSKWEIFDYIPIPFTHKNEICYIHAEQSYLAINSNENIIKLISGNSLKFCDKSDGLCYVDFFESHTDDSPLCAKALFQGKTPTELNNICSYKCEPRHAKPFIKKIENEIYILTNHPTNLEIYDHKTNHSKTLDVNATISGALKLKLPCHMDLRSKNEILIPKKFPCIKTEINKMQIHRILPTQWSTYDTLSIDSTSSNQVLFNNMSKILNQNWKKLTPNFEIKTTTQELKDRIKLMELKPPPKSLYESNFIGDLIHLVWLLILTILTLINLYLLIRLYISQMRSAPNILCTNPPPLPPRIHTIRRSITNN